MLRRLMLLLFLCCGLPASGMAAVDAPGWQFVLIREGSGQLEQIRQLPDASWQAAPASHAVNPGLRQGSLWLRARVTAERAGLHVLELKNPQHDLVRLYVLHPDEAPELLRGGFRERFPSRPAGGLHNQRFDFQLDYPGQTAELYLQVESARPLFVWPHVSTVAEHSVQSADERFWLGLYAGAFFAASFFSLLMWLATRDRDYLDNLLLIALMGAVQLQMLGVWYEGFLHVWPAGMGFAGVLLPTLALYAFCRFARRFLDLAQTSPRLDHYLRRCTWAILALLPLYFLLGGRITLALCGLFGVSFSGLAIVAGVRVLLQGFRPAAYYLLAQIPLVLGGATYVASNFGLLATTPASMYAFQIGALLSVMTYSMAVAWKVRVMRYSQMRAQGALLETEQRLVDALRESEAKLELHVQQRTQELEAALQQLQLQKEALEHHHRELNRLHEERGAFLQIAAHDLKNPTAAIISYADLLRERWHAWDEAKKLKRIGNIRELSQLIFEIIGNLLELDAIESGHLALRPTTVNAVDTLRTLADEYRPRCELKHIQIHLALPDEAVQLRIDRTALYQIIDNLVSNAVKYSPHGRAIHLSIEQQIGHALIQVRDEGPGIAEEDQPRLFRKFTRLAARPTGGEHSTGLGLSIVKHLVEASGGHIGCLSRAGEGASFYVTLPLAAKGDPQGR